jgi:predicted small secreted protein
MTVMKSTAAIFALIFLAACANTVQGAGEDTAGTVNAAQGATENVVDAVE